MTWGATHLSVSFGTTQALNSVTAECVPGEILAVVGGDGAGKTTLMPALAGVALDHSGELHLPGPGSTGYVPAAGGVFGDLTIAEHLDFTSAAYGLTDWTARADDLLDRTDLGQFRGRLAGKLSGGQRRKLAAAMALLPNPQLLVLDEVTTGVDPVSRMGLWRLIAKAASEGAAVVFATTYLDEAERAASVLLLHEGRTLASGSPDQVIEQVPGALTTADSAGSTETAWRKGRRWRRWEPAGVTGTGEPPTLEDASIVAELRAELSS